MKIVIVEGDNVINMDSEKDDDKGAAARNKGILKKPSITGERQESVSDH